MLSLFELIVFYGLYIFVNYLYFINHYSFGVEVLYSCAGHTCLSGRFSSMPDYTIRGMSQLINLTSELVLHLQH